MSEWIKCRDQLPEPDTLCLGVDASEVIWTLLFDDDEFNSDTGDLYDTEITHWMPLPELPTK